MAATVPSRASRSAVAPARRGLSALRHELDDLVTRVWGEHEGSWLTGDFSPSFDLAETEKAFEIRLDAPGMECKDFEIEVNGNIVTIRGERKEEKEEKGKTFHRVERRYGAFSRTTTLPSNVNSSEVAAEYSKGVLTVTLPKRDEETPTKISVKSGAG